MTSGTRRPERDQDWWSPEAEGVETTEGGGAAGGCQNAGSGAEGTESGAETETPEVEEKYRASLYRSDGASSWDRWDTDRGASGRFVAADEAERFWSYVDRSDPDGCWLWTGGVTADGYGRFVTQSGRIVRAHRHAYELLVGPIPPGHTVDHLIGPSEPCTSTLCVRAPDHLEPVTNAENLRRRHARRRATHDREETTP
jgi:hypothetical protein